MSGVAVSGVGEGERFGVAWGVFGRKPCFLFWQFWWVFPCFSMDFAGLKKGRSF